MRQKEAEQQMELDKDKRHRRWRKQGGHQIKEEGPDPEKAGKVIKKERNKMYVLGEGTKRKWREDEEGKGGQRWEMKKARRQERGREAKSFPCCPSSGHPGNGPGWREMHFFQQHRSLFLMADVQEAKLNFAESIPSLISQPQPALMAPECSGLLRDLRANMLAGPMPGCAHRNGTCRSQPGVWWQARVYRLLSHREGKE